MKLFVYGFWSGFIEKTNPVHISFFIDLFQKVFDTKIELGTIEDSDILLETIFESNTYLYSKNWKYTFLFSGESRLNAYHKDYNCILYGEKNHSNIINVPLFISTLYCSKLSFKKNINNIPKKNICAILSNSNGKERNYFLNKLEKFINVDYCGNYKTNIPIITHQYNTQEFIDAVSQYKFIVTMENSRGETYITEKILHGFNAGIIPIYWGSIKISDYFNEKRFLQIKNMNNEEEIENIIHSITTMTDETYIQIVNENILKTDRNINTIANDIRTLLFNKGVSKTYFVCSQEFEPMRFERLKREFNKIGWNNTKFICPTYKHTITQDIMSTYVKNDLIKKTRNCGMKKSEVSLFLNYKAVLEDIYRNYSDGLFLIFESDVLIIEQNIGEFDAFFNAIYDKKDNWDLIHIGSDLVNNQYFTKPYCDCALPYRNKVVGLPEKYIEDITSPNDNYRLVRKFHTRCTDSFLWNYTGIVKFLNYMNENPYYNAPFDYYLTNFFENIINFKQYWSLNTFFYQASNFEIDSSTIQNDID
jgi:hypothetical protein